MTDHDEVALQLAAVKESIDRAAQDFGRRPGGVALVAVSKTMPAERIRPALEAGHRIFGENRVQEAQGKWPALRTAFPDVELHLIGPLQTNKVRDAVALFDVIQTLDRPSLARELRKEMDRQERTPRLLVQVNTGAEPQKAGIDPREVAAFLVQCRDEFGLTPDGLMCIPPVDEPPSAHFALLAKLAAEAGLPWLSMGMSADYEAAIQLGATHVRVGSAIFGARAPLTE